MIIVGSITLEYNVKVCARVQGQVCARVQECLAKTQVGQQ